MVSLLNQSNLNEIGLINKEKLQKAVVYHSCIFMLEGNPNRNEDINTGMIGIMLCCYREECKKLVNKKSAFE